MKHAALLISLLLATCVAQPSYASSGKEVHVIEADSPYSADIKLFHTDRFKVQKVYIGYCFGDISPSYKRLKIYTVYRRTYDSIDVSLVSSKSEADLIYCLKD